MDSRDASASKNELLQVDTSLLKLVPAALDLHRSNDKHLAGYLDDEICSA